MHTAYAIVHFWSLRGGFRKRMGMLADTLVQKAAVAHVSTLSQLWDLVRSAPFRRGEVSLIIYTSLLAPLILLLKCVHPAAAVYYMVRGDEITYARRAKRRLRAWVALRFQKLLGHLRCCFIFASEDLREAFEKRLGDLSSSFVLPNTLGETLPEIRPFDGRLAVVGDFRTVKNVEAVISSLSSGMFHVDLYGNRSMPDQWSRDWLTPHGVVEDLRSHLCNCSLVVFSSVSEGFPNVLLEALQAGCAVVTHGDFPFRRFPLSPQWRFELNGSGSNLEAVLQRLLQEQRDFKRDNKALVRLVESDWNQHVWEVFGHSYKRAS